MKRTLWMCILTIGLFLAAPTASYAQYTDEDLEYQGGNPVNEDWGPVSLYPTLMGGVISHTKGTISSTFWDTFGEINMKIVDEMNNTFMTKQLYATAGQTDIVDVRWLPKGRYTIMYGNSSVLQTAVFNIY